MRQLIKTYYKVMAITKQIQLGLNNATASRINRLGIVDSQVQVIEDNTIKEDNDKEDLNRADDIVYIGQPVVKDFKNLAKPSKLINNAKY